jgi:hypothetical protein
MFVELIENGIEAEKRKQQGFFELAERLRNAHDPEKANASAMNSAGRSLAADAQDRELRQSTREHPTEYYRPHARRAITLADLNQRRLWIASQPEVPAGGWYKDFGSFKIRGRGSYLKTF